MDLNTIWFLLIAVLYVGFFVLEGFDFGVGILLPFLSRDKDGARTEHKRRVMINAIGPHWDGNEVWLLTAGGATFAAFPHWYATLFSGFYLALLFLLLALIMRGVALEFRSKDPDSRWRRLWDWSIFGGSLVSTLLLGVAFGNLAAGVPVDADMNYVGTFFTLLNPYALLAGIATLLAFALHGAIFLCLKTVDDLQASARKTALRLWIPVVLALLALLVSTYFATDMLDTIGVNPGVVPITGIIAILLTGYFLRAKRDGLAFAMTAISIAVAVFTVFLIMYPRVMISTIDPAYSMTIYSASSSPYTLQIMTIVGLVFLPVVLSYQAWSYWVFRKRITVNSELVY